MAKFLQGIQIWYAQGNHWAEATDNDPELSQAIGPALPPALRWMYEHCVQPLQSQGIVKVNVMFTQAESRSPVVIPHTPEAKEGEGIAYVSEHFDLAHFQSQDIGEQRIYLLDRLHAALINCAATFGWNTEQLIAARERVVRDHFQFSFWWKKPVSSPDRKHKVQAFIEVADQAAITLVFTDRQQQEVHRALLCTAPPRSGLGELELHKVQWLDAETVQVTQQNKRDYWLCKVNGEAEFHFPRAEQGDPHGQYQLGQLYWEGRFVPRDRERGLEWMRAAAKQGYGHARRWLEREDAL